MLSKISKKHPRYESLLQREKLVEGYEKGITVLAGLIAHGRGEAFDYLIGEKTIEPAKKAIKASAALLLLAKSPVISVNGNTAVLCAREIIKLASLVNAKIEVNLFYRSEERERKIAELLKAHGAKEVYGVSPTREIEGIASDRRKVDEEGIYKSDVVLVAIEDGDRTEALVKHGKNVIAIDLNPLSRTARYATITIVDNVIRAFPMLIKEVGELKNNLDMASKILASYDNVATLREVLNHIKRRLEKDEIIKAWRD